MPRTPPAEWGNLFNFAGGGLIHIELFSFTLIMAQGPTWLELIAENLLQYGTAAARPAANTVPDGAYYYSTDTNVLSQSRSGSWSALSPSAVPYDPPRAQAINTTSQSIANNTSTALTFASAQYDTDGMWRPGTSTAKLFCTTPGLYAVTAQISWDNNTSGYRAAALNHSGGRRYASDYRPPTDGGQSEASLAAQVTMEEDDWIEFRVRQTSGGALDAYADGEYVTSLAAALIASA